MNTQLKPIAAALKSAREGKGLSQRDLAQRVGLPQSHISKIENAAVDLQTTNLIEIARALDLELTLIPRAALPAVQSLQHVTPARVSARAIQAMRKQAQHLAEAAMNAAQRYPNHRVFAAIERTAGELARRSPGTLSHSAIQQINLAGGELLEQFRTLNTLDSSPEILQSTLERARFFSAKLRQLRNASALSQPLPLTKPLPAYRLEDEEENSA